MANYAILLYAPVDVEVEPTPEEMRAHERHAKELQQSGALVGAFALQPAATATSIRGDVISDGPFLEAKEVIVGFYVLEAHDLDAALDIARRNPILQQGGGVEVWPVAGSFRP
jgi:hypothetical protein